jgi:hypothetical protein
VVSIPNFYGVTSEWTGRWMDTDLFGSNEGGWYRDLSVNTPEDMELRVCSFSESEL